MLKQPEADPKQEDNTAKVKAAIAAEPDRDIASTMLTEYLRVVASTVVGGHVELDMVSAKVTFAGRNHRIMPNDYLLRKSETGESLCRCTGIGDFMSRRRVKDFNRGAHPNNMWTHGDRVVFGSDENEYTVITDAAARRLFPQAFTETKGFSRTESTEPI